MDLTKWSQAEPLLVPGPTTKLCVIDEADPVNKLLSIMDLFNALPGIQGLTGLQGVQGAQGKAGCAGSQGVQGKIGVGIQGLAGLAAAQGSCGSQGIQGVQGTQGLQGLQGCSVQGAEGSQGDLGIQGLQGIQGEAIQGTSGCQGGMGIQGDTGSQGAVGDQGIQGTYGAQGTRGTQGDIGSQGLFGSQGNIGAQGPEGEQGRPGDDGLQGTTGQSIQGIQGKTGEIGIQGNIGETGVQGETGAQGDTGIQGDLGVQGEQGDSIQGIAGEYAAQGVQGTQGNGFAGTQGAQGIAGEYAAQGVQGSFGVQGDLGIQGEIGESIQGTMGVQGDIGTQGDLGAQGMQGIIGIQGFSGVQGAFGIQGAQGKIGSQGIRGSQGEVGSQGTYGTQGAFGAQGWQGEDGIQGVFGSQGLQGTQGQLGVQGNEGIQGVQGDVSDECLWDWDGTGVYTQHNVAIGKQTIEGIQGLFAVQGNTNGWTGIFHNPVSGGDGVYIVAGSTSSDNSLLVTSAAYTRLLQMKGDGTFFLNNGIGNASTSNVLFYNTSTGQVSYGALSGIQGVQGTSGTGIQGNIGAQGTSGGGEESCLWTDGGDYTYLTDNDDKLVFGINTDPAINTITHTEQTNVNHWIANFQGAAGSYGVRIRATQNQYANALDISDYSNTYGLLKVRGDGRLILPQYGDGSIQGTVTYVLGVDADGNVFETIGGGGGGIQGIQGTQGAFGNGTQGVQGQAIQGIQGKLGLQGVQGVQGLMGIQGSDMGAQGVQGAAGVGEGGSCLWTDGGAFTYLTQTTDKVSIGKNTNSGKTLEVNGNELITADTTTYALGLTNNNSYGNGLYILGNHEDTTNYDLLIESGVLGAKILEATSDSSYGYIKIPTIPPATVSETKILKWNPSTGNIGYADPESGSGVSGIYHLPFEFCISSVADDYTIDIEAVFNYTINSAILEVEGDTAGVTATVTLKKGTTIANATQIENPITVTTTRNTTTFTPGNSVTLGQRIIFTTTAGATADIIRGKLKITRTT